MIHNHPVSQIADQHQVQVEVDVVSLSLFTYHTCGLFLLVCPRLNARSNRAGNDSSFGLRRLPVANAMGDQSIGEPIERKVLYSSASSELVQTSDL